MVRFTGSRLNVYLTSLGTSILNEYFDETTYKYYSASDLGCTKDTSKCSSKCSNKGGKWDHSSRECIVTMYLNEVCYRVTRRQNKWVLDSPP